MVFKILAFVNAAGVVLAIFPPITPVSTLLTLAFNAAAAALAGVYWLQARGLERRASWAVAAARPLLLLAVVAGVHAVFAAVAEGRIRIPFEVAMAAWALAGSADRRPIPGIERRTVLALAVAVVLLVQLALGSRVFGWDGLLDVRPHDLEASIQAECGAPGEGLPPTIAVTYDWTWLRRTPVPSGIDIVVLGWTGADAEGRPLYIIGRIPDTGRGVRAGLEGYPSGSTARSVGEESEGSYRWAIALDQQALAPGHIEVQLRLARDAPPEHGTLLIKATYIHLGAWREDVTLTCTW